MRTELCVHAIGITGRDCELRHRGHEPLLHGADNELDVVLIVLISESSGATVVKRETFIVLSFV